MPARHSISNIAKATHYPPHRPDDPSLHQSSASARPFPSPVALVHQQRPLLKCESPPFKHCSLPMRLPPRKRCSVPSQARHNTSKMPPSLQRTGPTLPAIISRQRQPGRFDHRLGLFTCTAEEARNARPTAFLPSTRSTHRCEETPSTYFSTPASALSLSVCITPSATTRALVRPLRWITGRYVLPCEKAAPGALLGCQRG